MRPNGFLPAPRVEMSCPGPRMPRLARALKNLESFLRGTPVVLYAPHGERPCLVCLLGAPLGNVGAMPSHAFPRRVTPVSALAPLGKCFVVHVHPLVTP